MWKRFLVGAALIGGTAAGAPLPEDPAGRRAIRGAPVETAQESEELRALRRFDEESFPRAPVYVPAPADPANEGPAPPAPPPRPSTETPPEPLASPQAQPPAADAPETAVPWLAGLKLPDIAVRWDPRVIRYLEFYKNDKRGHAIMASWLRRQGRYKELIEDALRRYHLPHSLLYVAMIESGYDPLDRSSAGAAGLWQFMTEGGRIYGLRIDHWVDERKNPEKATEAVMHYWSDLQARFGAWHLALAAFNAGYGAVLRAVGKYNTNDYWELVRHEDGLPWETTLYVPKALAAAIVGENREAFGYADVTADPAWEFDRVSVPSTTSLAAIARAAGVPAQAVAELNPELRRGRTPPEPWVARVPKGAGARFAANFEKNREKVQTYVARFGERLDDVARRFGATPAELKRLNGFDDGSPVRPGLTMVVPEGRAPLAPPPEEAYAIVAVPDKTLVVKDRKRVFYRALPGDSVKDIAAFFKVTPIEIAKWNNVDQEAALTSRMILQLWVQNDFDTAKAALVDAARVRLVTVGSDEFFDLVEARAGRKRLTVTVKAGDTLKKIGKKYHLTEADLERINRFGRKSELKLGQKLTVYVAMTEKEKRAAQEKLLAAPPPPDEEDAPQAEVRLPRPPEKEEEEP